MNTIVFESPSTRMRAFVQPSKRRGAWTCYFTFKNMDRHDKPRQIDLPSERQAYEIATDYVNGLPYPELAKRWKPQPIK